MYLVGVVYTVRLQKLFYKRFGIVFLQNNTYRNYLNNFLFVFVGWVLFFVYYYFKFFFKTKERVGYVREAVLNFKNFRVLKGR